MSKVLKEPKPVGCVHEPGGESVLCMTRVRDPDVGKDILDGGGGGEVLVKEQLLWDNSLVISLVWTSSKVPRRSRLEVLSGKIMSTHTLPLH